MWEQGVNEMLHKVKVTVIDKKLYPELQEAYCMDPKSGACPCYNVGDTFIFERAAGKDDFLLPFHPGKGRRKSGRGRRRAEDAFLLGSMGCDFPLYLHGAAGRLNHARLDEG